MSQTPMFDHGIPMLTEVLRDGPPEAPPAPEQPAIPAWSAHDWDRLEERLSERILLQLQGHVDAVLEQHIAAALQRAMAGMAGELRQNLQQSIENIVAQAVGHELTRLQTGKL